MIRIHTQLVGQPKTVTEDDGQTWTSTIFRHAVSDPILLTLRGLTGDQVADTANHGKPEQAVCCHFLEHYQYWNSRYGLAGESALKAGSVGENWTLEGATEKDVCIGDIYRVGTARVQVSQPRFPCWKQERKVKINGFLKDTMDSLRSGFYVRVLEEGTVKVGDEMQLEQRIYPDLTIEAINNNGLRIPTATIVEQATKAEELAPFWRRLISENVRKYEFQEAIS